MEGVYIYTYKASSSFISKNLGCIYKMNKSTPLFGLTCFVFIFLAAAAAAAAVCFYLYYMDIICAAAATALCVYV